MLLGVVLLYVGAVLVINGIWLVGTARAAARLRPATAGGPEGLVTAEEETEADPTFIQNREIAALNIFTGFIGVVAAVTLVIQGNRDEDIASIRAAGYILLFAFTYLWVAYNQFMNVSGHAFGWYCLFVALTAIPAGIYSFANADGNDASIYLGIDWFAWAILWFLFFVLLALGRPIARLTGWVAILEGIGTAWVFAILLLEEELMF